MGLRDRARSPSPRRDALRSREVLRVSRGWSRDSPPARMRSRHLVEFARCLRGSAVFRADARSPVRISLSKSRCGEMLEVCGRALLRGALGRIRYRSTPSWSASRDRRGAAAHEPCRRSGGIDVNPLIVTPCARRGRARSGWPAAAALHHGARDTLRRCSAGAIAVVVRPFDFVAAGNRFILHLSLRISRQALPVHPIARTWRTACLCVDRGRTGVESLRVVASPRRGVAAVRSFAGRVRSRR